MNKTSIIEMTGEEAKRFFLRSKNYCSLDLPKYFNFQPIIDTISGEFDKGWKLNDKCSNMMKGKVAAINEDPKQLRSINYRLYSNKDGRFAWRPLQIIHPFVYSAEYIP